MRGVHKGTTVGGNGKRMMGGGYIVDGEVISGRAGKGSGSGNGNR